MMLRTNLQVPNSIILQRCIIFLCSHAIYPQVSQLCFASVFHRRHQNYAVTLHYLTCSLQCIYSKPRCSVFTSVATCAVVHHVQSPDFYEEIKICLPCEITERHHLLMTFYHVSCESSVKQSRQSVRGGVDTVVGYSWIPLMRQKRYVIISIHLLFRGGSCPLLV